MFRETSREAYRSLENINRKQREVYETIKHLGSACNYEVARYLGWPINAVTPRTGELVSYELVEESHRAVSPTGRKAIYWKVKKDVTQGELFNVL